MTLRFIHGKPGSGKSCYCVSLLVNMLGDWARYKIDHGESYPRILFTNIPLYVEEINKYLSREIGQEVDLSAQIELLDEDFFWNEKREYRDWWEDFPEKSFAVIDEVHHYLPSSLKTRAKGKECADKFMEFISMHRHKQMDLILMSQHIDKVNSEAKKDIQEVYEVLNVKSATVGFWPFTVPMSDIDVVRESWGMPVQMAHIRRDICESKSRKKDKNYDVFILRPALFKLYRSHTLSEEALDRPSLKLGRIGSIMWFLRRHTLRLGFWSIVVVSGFFSIRNLMSEFPNMLVKSMIPTPAKTVVSKESTVSTTVPHMVIADNSVAHVVDDQIIGFVKGGVITPKGVLRKNDHIIIDGDKDFVSSVDLQRGILYLGSGKKVQK